MFDFSSSLFWYKLIFMSELVVGELIFVINLRRRANFALRCALCLTALFSVAFLLPILEYDAWWTSTAFILMFLASLCAMKICFRESWWNIVFCGLAAYTVQHIAYVAFSALNDVAATVFGISVNINPYVPLDVVSSGYQIAGTAVIYLTVYLMVYMMSHYAYTDKINPDEVVKLGRTRFVALAAVILITDNVFSAITTYVENVNLVYVWIERGYNILTCILALQLQFSQLTEKETHTKLDMVQHILREEQKQYEIVKQNLDVVNVKCHDMKHQLRAIRSRGGAFDEQEMKEIEKVVSVYESVVKTGNDTLDLILTEKNMMNQEKGVTITCIADGSRLDFIKPADLYALFGNALDNAIEAVCELAESKRNVNLSIKRVGNFVSVHLENYFKGEIVMKDNLPATSKSDHNYHGYGFLSMKLITERYGGTLAVQIVGDIFNLNILFPAGKTDGDAKCADRAGETL